MIRMIMVTGESLSPTFHEGDYVVITTIPFVIDKIKSGDTIVFRHPSYGMLIKQVERIDLKKNAIFVSGLNHYSVDSRRFGPIQREDVIGKVIWHLARPKG